MRESAASLSEKLPSVKDGDVRKLIAVPEEFSEKLSTHVSDLNRVREMGKDRGRWRRWLPGDH